MELQALWDVTQQFNNKNGTILTSGKIYIYFQNRTALATTYHDEAGTVVNSNPILLDNNGRATVFADTAYSYTIVVCDYYGKELFSQDIILHNAIATVENVLITGSDGSVTIDTTELSNGVKYDLSVNTDIIATKQSVDDVKSDLEDLTLVVNNNTIDIDNIQDELTTKKDKQTTLTYNGSATKTIKNITQNANGEMTVEFEDIDLPPEVPNVEITSPNGTIDVQSSTDVGTNTKTFTIDIAGDDVATYAFLKSEMPVNAAQIALEYADIHTNGIHWNTVDQRLEFSDNIKLVDLNFNIEYEIDTANGVTYEDLILYIYSDFQVLDQATFNIDTSIAKHTCKFNKKILDPSNLQFVVKVPKAGSIAASIDVNDETFKSIAGTYELSAGEGIDITDYPNEQKTVISVTAQGGNTEVSHDNTLSGNGTVDSPLSVVPGYNETVLWRGNVVQNSGGNLSDCWHNYDKIKVYGYSEPGGSLCAEGRVSDLEAAITDGTPCPDINIFTVASWKHRANYNIINSLPVVFSDNYAFGTLNERLMGYWDNEFRNVFDSTRVHVTQIVGITRTPPIPTDMVLLINSPNAGDFSVTTNYGTFTAAKVPDCSAFGTTVTHKLSISGVTFSTGQKISDDSAVRGLFVGVESWGTSNTYTNASHLFNECTSLRGIPGSWAGLGALTKASYMFRGCTSLTSIPAASWEGLGSLKDASYMFAGCTYLTSIPASWEGLGSLTNANYMFQNCTSLASIPASWTGLGAVTDASAMFYRCTSLTRIPLSWEGLVNLTNATAMFDKCTSLTSIPLSWEGLVNLTNATAMFRGCTSLTNCGTIFTGLAKATNVSYLFEGCTGMQGDIHALYVYLSTKPIAVTSFDRCFRGCTQAVGYSSIPSSWR